MPWKTGIESKQDTLKYKCTVHTGDEGFRVYGKDHNAMYDMIIHKILWILSPQNTHNNIKRNAV